MGNFDCAKYPSIAVAMERARDTKISARKLEGDMVLNGCVYNGNKRLTAKVSGWLKASPLERRVRPEGQKGAPSLEDVRGP